MTDVEVLSPDKTSGGAVLCLGKVSCVPVPVPELKVG